jgi:hypothetical protein
MSTSVGGGDNHNARDLLTRREQYLCAAPRIFVRITAWQGRTADL